MLNQTKLGANEEKRARFWRHEMRQMHGVQPTRMVWSCLVTCCLKARDLSRAVLSLEYLDNDGASLGTGRISMYAAVIESCITSGEVTTALQMVDWAYTRAPPEDARTGLSMDLLKRVFESAVFRGAETTYWSSEWDNQWTEWEDNSAAHRQPTQSPRGRKPQRQPDQSPRSRNAPKGKGKVKGKQKSDNVTSHPFGKGGAEPLPPWPTWDVTEAGISPFSSNAGASSDMATAHGSTLQQMAGQLRKAYQDADTIPDDVQELLDRADKEANRSNIMSLHSATQTLDRAQIALQEATTARKEHRLHWTKHVAEGIKIWEAQLESFRVHQAALSEKAAAARAEINSARRAIQELSDTAVKEGNRAIPQPIHAEAEMSTVELALDAEEQKLRDQLQGVLQACAGSLGVSSQIPDDKIVELLSDEDKEKEHQLKRPRSQEPPKGQRS
eukprot:s854_g7.t1